MIINSLEKRPKTVQFETHSMCNAKCNFCCHSIMKRKKGRMSDELIDKILSQADGVETLIPFLMGEPFLDNRLINILKKCRQLQPNCSIVLYSNMSMCNEKYAIDILENDLVDEIYISFYGINPDQYLKLQGLDYYNVLENIIFLVKERNKRDLKKPRIICNYILMHELMPYLKQFQDFWKPIVDEVRIVFYDDWHGDQTDRGSEYHPVQLQRIPCYRLWSSLNIHWNGDVPLCCMDYNSDVVIGNINDQSIKEIWNSDKLKEIRDLHINQEYDKIPMCKKCSSWKCNNPNWWNTMWNIVYSEV